jgi:GGDEF domain-containing protein
MTDHKTSDAMQLFLALKLDEGEGDPRASVPGWLPLESTREVPDIELGSAALLLRSGEGGLLVEPRRLEAVPEGSGDVMARASRQLLGWWRNTGDSQVHQQRWEHVVNLRLTLAQVMTRESALAEVQECLRVMFPHRPVLLLERALSGSAWQPATSLMAISAATRLPGLERLRDPGVWTMTQEASAKTAEWLPLRRTLSSQRVAHVPVGESVLLLLGLPDGDRVAIDEWPLLLSVARTLAMVLEDLRRGIGDRSLPLSDPDTSLANRLHMEVVMKQYLALADRGSPLSVVVMAMAGENARDRDHIAAAARLTRSSVRGADLVARYGPDRFVLILPQCADSGAQRVIYRIRERGGSEISFDAGVAEFGPGLTTMDQLIALATDSMERARKRRAPTPD